MNNPKLLLLAGIIAAASSAESHAAEFLPSIGVGVTTTDNLTNASEDEVDETIFRIEPAIRFEHESDTLEVNLDYLMQALQYDDLGEDEVFHQGAFDSQLNFLEKALYFGVGASRAQTVINPELDVPIGNLPISGNRQDQDTYYLRPGFEFRLSPTIITEGSFEASRVTNGAEELAGADADLGDANFSVNNYQDNDGISWALRYVWRRAEYDEFDPFENQRATAELGFWVTRSSRVFASGGMESAWDNQLEPALEDALWEVGFAHQGGERLQAEFAYGERSFGDSFRGNIDWSFRRGSMNLSYEQTPTTQALEQFREGGFFDPTTIDDLITRPGEAQRFVANNLRWSMNVEFPKLQISMSLFDLDRTDRTNPDGTPRPDENFRGLTSVFTYRLGARTSVTADANWNTRSLEDQSDRDILWAGLGIDYRLRRRLSVSLNYQYIEESIAEDALAGEYQSNLVTLMFRWGAEGSDAVRAPY